MNYGAGKTNTELQILLNSGELQSDKEVFTLAQH